MGGAWQPLNNTWGAAWETPTAPLFPLDVRVTSDSGQQASLFRPKRPICRHRWQSACVSLAQASIHGAHCVTVAGNEVC